MLEQQIELEKRMTQTSIDNYRRELEKSKQNNTFGCSPVANRLYSIIMEDFVGAIEHYLSEYAKGKAVKSTIAANTILRLNDNAAIAFMTSKVIFNYLYQNSPVQSLYRNIGQTIEDEFKMRTYRNENSHYYKSIQEDLNKRGAKANRKKNITTGVFNKRLDFHLEKWSVTEKIQTGLVLVNLFVQSTGLVEIVDFYKRRKTVRTLVPTDELLTWIEDVNYQLEVMQPFFLPMVCEPKDWTSVLDGGYISPYIRKNKLIKNNDKDYLTQLESADMPIVYEAINHLQKTAWQINTDVLNVVQELWEQGKAIAELPDREDEPLIPFPYPEHTKEDAYTPEEAEIVKKWKRDTYDIHKRNVQKRSIRILTSQIIKIARHFKDYPKIYFPHQMDFRGRLYPIPVLLQPQGSDLAKGLLKFANGKKVDGNSIKWLQIHGANVYGYDKESYSDRIEWTKAHQGAIISYATDPLCNLGWAEADKPFQFLAFCFEYNKYLSDPDNYTTHIPIQLDGTCNGLQHYSALLRDEISGEAVNLVPTDKPNDIYGIVAIRLENKLLSLQKDTIIAQNWVKLGINRKLTKRPVMVLPYGGTMLSCREYIQEYLTDNFSPDYIWEVFNVGDSPTDCNFKISVWLSKYLWDSITETLKSAIIGMDYLKKLARIITKEGRPIEWFTPAGLFIRQAYKARHKKMIKTELFGSMVRAMINMELDSIYPQRQLNGICPNFIHSLDAACLMIYLVKCKQAGIESFMTVHDCYGTLAPDTDISAELLREAFVEVYRQPILENFTEDVLYGMNVEPELLPKLPIKGKLNIDDVLKSEYFFN